MAKKEKVTWKFYDEKARKRFYKELSVCIKYSFLGVLIFFVTTLIFYAFTETSIFKTYWREITGYLSLILLGTFTWSVSEYFFKEPINLWVDFKESRLNLSRSFFFHRKTKHIDYGAIQYLVYDLDREENYLEIHYVDQEQQLQDYQTHLAPLKFVR